MFSLGTIIVFYSQFFLINEVNSLKSDQAYFERVIDQIQISSGLRETYLFQYNNAVSSKPQNKDMLGFSAFKLYTETDKLLTLLMVSGEHQGNDESQTFVDEKNKRFDIAESLLKAKKYSKLVSLLNEITSRHDEKVEPSTKKVMTLWEETRSNTFKTSLLADVFNICGLILLVCAFLLREYRDYKAHNKSLKQDK
ncbi:hypothetical protein MASE_08830 [Alteromonas macleodii ATCC 27126]|nr:hypothetical protein MASE_08830 [Alteromonas macleodii ATCC 27126]